MMTGLGCHTATCTSHAFVGSSRGNNQTSRGPSSRGYLTPRGPHRTVGEPLGSYLSCRSGHQACTSRPPAGTASAPSLGPTPSGARPSGAARKTSANPARCGSRPIGCTPSSRAPPTGGRRFTSRARSSAALHRKLLRLRPKAHPDSFFEPRPAGGSFQPGRIAAGIGVIPTCWRVVEISIAHAHSTEQRGHGGNSIDLMHEQSAAGPT
jgi:hypothetical protein